MKKLTLFILLILGHGFLFGQAKDNMECRALYDAQKFEESYKCYIADDKELFSVYMAAYLAKFLEYKKEFKTWYKKLISDDFKTSEKYYYAANLHPKNSKKYLKTINKGLKEYENDTLLLKAKINYYLEVKDYEAGLTTLEQYATSAKNINAEYTFVTEANILRFQEKYQKAIPLYIKALAINDQNFESNYWLGMIYYGQAVDLIQLSGTSADEESKKLEKEALSLLSKSLPYLELAFKLDPENKEIKSALLTCYKKLEMNTEYQMMKNL